MFNILYKSSHMLGGTMEEPSNKKSGGFASAYAAHGNAPCSGPCRLSCSCFGSYSQIKPPLRISQRTHVVPASVSPQSTTASQSNSHMLRAHILAHRWS